MFEPPGDWHAGLPRADSWLERYGAADTIRDPEMQLSLGWTLALTEQMQVIEEVEAVMATVPYARRAAIGLLSPEMDHEIIWPPYFGVIIYGDAAPGFEVAEPIGRTIATEGAEFPIVVRRGAFVSHAVTVPTVRAGQGRVAYWARSRVGRQGVTREGWLTAEHAADNLAVAHAGQVVDRAQHCLDAALVDFGNRPGQVPRVAAYNAICATLPVEIGLPTPVRAQVIDVEASLHLLRWSSRFPLRFSMNAHGKLGDSGSRITEDQTGNDTPLGIYLGAFDPSKPTSTGGKAGYGLALCQLEQLIGLEVCP